MSQQIYQIMRTQIVVDIRHGGSTFSEAYAYAWSVDLYPFLHDTAMQRAFKSEFEITESDAMEVFSFIGDKFDKDETLTFYGLEDQFGGKFGDSSAKGTALGRLKLMRIVRYIALHDQTFGSEFWATLLKNGSCPSEALSLKGPLSEWDISLF
jgi:hypothetical protein